MNKLFLAALLATAAVAPALAADDAATLSAAEQRKLPMTVNLPYSAIQTLTTHKLLGDGNEIVTEQVSRLYRDSAGRMRTDTLDRQGDVASTAIVGTDGMRYVLDARRRTVTRTPMMLVSGTGARTEVKVSGAGVTSEKLEQMKGEVLAKRQGMAKHATKALGEREVDGVVATGTESRSEIPADAAGNSRPIEIISEGWWSKELRIHIYYRQNDPRTGEWVRALSNIERTEPDAALFEIPRDYKLLAPTLDASFSR